MGECWESQESAGSPRDAGGSGCPEDWHDPEAAHMLQAMGLPPAPLPAKSSILLLFSSSTFPPFLLARASFDHEPISTVIATWHLLATSPFFPSVGAPNPPGAMAGVDVWPEPSSAPPPTPQDAGLSQHLLLPDDKGLFLETSQHPWQVASSGRASSARGCFTEVSRALRMRRKRRKSSLPPRGKAAWVSNPTLWNLQE